MAGCGNLTQQMDVAAAAVVVVKTAVMAKIYIFSSVCIILVH